MRDHDDGDRPPPVYGPSVERHRRVSTSASIALGLMAVVLFGPRPTLVGMWVFFVLGASLLMWLVRFDTQTREHVARTGEPWPDDWAVQRRHPLVFGGAVVSLVVAAYLATVSGEVPVGIAFGGSFILSTLVVQGLHSHYRRTGRTPAKAPLKQPHPWAGMSDRSTGG